MSSRDTFLAELVDHLTARDVGHPLRVGVDGTCGSGKSTLAGELASVISAQGRAAIHLDSDGFHNIRAIRYRRGRTSARGYYEDAYDFGALVARVLVPLGPSGTNVYATKVHDMQTDVIVTDTNEKAPNDAVVLFDCTFLQRGSLRDYWDDVIYLQVDRDIAVSRGVARDAAVLGGAVGARQAYEDRYMAACDIYVREERPAERASILVAYDDLVNSRILRGVESLSAELDRS